MATTEKLKAKERIIGWILGILGPVLLYLWGWSLRVKWLNPEQLESVYARGKRAIFIAWHGGLFIPMYAFRNRKIHILLSRSKDGEYVAGWIKRMGYSPIRGSTSAGAHEAIFEMVSFLKAGEDVAVTPDGPKGPHREIKRPGPVLVASRSGCPIVPLAAGASRFWRLKTWDNFLIPKPFSRVVVVLGRPVEVPEDLGNDGLAKYVAAAADSLADATNRAESYFERRRNKQ